MDDKLDDDSFFDQLKALNLKPIEKSRPDTQSAFDESRRDVVKFNMTIKATYHQNFVFHNANLCQIAHHQPNLLDHLPSLRMHTQYQPVRSTLLLNLHPHSPSLSATHIRFLYPQSIDFTSLKTDLSTRTILIETEIRDTDNLSSPGLPLIFNNKGIGSNEMLTVHKSCVRYHEQGHTFGDEIKVKLPLSYFPSEAHCNPNTLHPLFKFYHLECKNVKDGEPVTLQLIGHCVYPHNLFSSHIDLSQKMPSLCFQEGLEHGYLAHQPTRGLRQIDLSQSLFTTRNGTYFAPDAIWKDGVSDAKTLALSTLTDLISIIPSAKPTPNSSSTPGSPYTPSSPTTKHTRWSASSQQWPTPCFSRFVSTVEKVFQIEVTELSNAVESDQSKRSSTSRSSSTSALSTLLSPPHNLMSSRQKKAKTRNHPLSSPSSPPTTTRSFQTFCTNPSAASSRFIAMLLCNIVSLAAQRSSACDKTKQSQSNLSFLPATLPRKERHSIAESMLALRLNMFSKEKWKPHKFLQLIQRILFDLLDSEMHKLGSQHGSQVHLRDLRGVYGPNTTTSFASPFASKLVINPFAPDAGKVVHPHLHGQMLKRLETPD
ncbi:hypothetical protein BLNAU_10518 [Blattamonas nauphoetae]|uniref:C2 DOCK-type domain-containing protein n=1 Tax=Blattamonas nauphoetae TaxID=2049346 RepID=A0ABQ9XS66_9EUKA|nr:hypothetical protein BLNAU_10518 [Blattamonas nauphoetae]